MKKLFLVLCVLPFFAVAETPEDSSQSASFKQIQHGLMCGRLSDNNCFGRPVDSVCIKDVRRGQTGVCRQVSIVYEDNTVTCRCF